MSSITPEPRVISHFTHAHALTEFNGTGEFTCSGCNVHSSYGTAYRCVECKYDLHEYCATCPVTLQAFSHPPHALRLVLRPTRLTEPRLCDMCERPVGGLFYECEPCGFRVHTLCTKLSQFARHALHPEHPLELSYTTVGACGVCGGACTSWRYGCFACGFNVHMTCLEATQGSTQPQQQQQQYHGYGVPYYAYVQHPPSSPHYRAQGVHPFGYENTPSSPQYHPGNGSYLGHRRVVSSGPIVDGGNGSETPKKEQKPNIDGGDGSETPKKEKEKEKKKKTFKKFATTIGFMAAHAMGLPGIDLLIDDIPGSDDSTDPQG